MDRTEYIEAVSVEGFGFYANMKGSVIEKARRGFEICSIRLIISLFHHFIISLFHYLGKSE